MVRVHSIMNYMSAQKFSLIGQSYGAREVFLLLRFYGVIRPAYWPKPFTILSQGGVLVKEDWRTNEGTTGYFSAACRSSLRSLIAMRLLCGQSRPQVRPWLPRSQQGRATAANSRQGSCL